MVVKKEVTANGDKVNADELKDIAQFEQEFDSSEGVLTFEKTVYLPQDDTYLLCDAADEFAKGDVLEVGCGNGLIAIECAKKGHKVTCCDINPYAVVYTKKMAQKEGATLTAIESDLFESIVEEFDTIIFNPPYLPEDEREPTDLLKIATTGGEQGDEVISRFFDEVGNYLKKDGIILLLFSSLTNRERVDEIITLYGYDKEQVREKSFFFERLYVYKITRK